MKLKTILPMLAVATFALSACAPKVEYKEFHEKAEAAVKGDAELERLIEAIKVCGNCNEVCEYMGCDKATIYNMKKRFIRRLEK